MPESVIASITSHSDIDAMRPYIQITEKGKAMLIDTLEGVVENSK